MEPHVHGQTLPDSSTETAGPRPGSRYNFRATPRGYLIPNSVAANTKLSDGAKLTWGLLRQFSFKDGCCYAKDESLALRIASSPRTLRRYIHELKAEGFVEVVQRGNRPSKRFLLWNDGFTADQKGEENPGPDSDLDTPEMAGETEPQVGQIRPASPAIFGELVGHIRPSQPNLMSSGFSSVLSSNNNTRARSLPPVENRVPVAAVAAQNPPSKPAPQKAGSADARIAELTTRGVMETTARRLLAELPSDFPFLDALDFYASQATAAGSRIRNVPGFLVTLLQGKILPPSNWETRAQRARRECEEREQAELDARQMEFNLQLETELDAAADAAVETLKTAEPEKFAQLVKSAKAELLSNPPGPSMPPEFHTSSPRFDAVVRQHVWKTVRQDLYRMRLAGSPSFGSIQL